MTIRPRRSALYMPGSNARALDKARTLAADTLILDLEDAVDPGRKREAREQVLAAIAAGGYGARELLVRANALDTPWGVDDLRALAVSGADGVVLSKVSSAAEVREAARLLEQAGAPQSLALWIMAETARCILDIDAIAGAHPRLRAILMGTADLARETRVRHTHDRIGFIATLNLCVLAARAHGLDIIDGVHLDLEDDAGLAHACEQGRDMGFDGKSLIHPRQLAAANRAFTPTAAALEKACELIDAWQQARARGSAVVVVNGRLVEKLHVAEAEREIELATAIAAMGW
ncbi:MAG: CoA ester lyase [Gammaproteobacteria bacterium]|jgi:citrate lyase subunit beta/citryl-CoA lyase|nr:CoA ester lyase [Gammaproteobacteria bacterium]MBP6053944.1 CoA ester lyase [Pseudomonadales bacterium]MBK6584599.1 CoA ester lyase [Gammaproteobacteria bacterium]MBK7519891.1 CoA ester lyase [Gammaproteobacteria bacterium]MBK7730864.1 CoA ester lyase [Gammaproteobacteria bacterium]